MKKFQMILSIAIASIFFSGCSLNKMVETPKEKKNSNEKIYSVNRILPYDNIVNMGQYAEAWIAPYKDKEDNLFNERKMNFWIIKPTFVIGENIPNNKVVVDEEKNKLIFNQNQISSGSKIELNNSIVKYLEKSK